MVPRARRQWCFSQSCGGIAQTVLGIAGAGIPHRLPVVLAASAGRILHSLPIPLWAAVPDRQSAAAHVLSPRLVPHPHPVPAAEALDAAAVLEAVPLAAEAVSGVVHAAVVSAEGPAAEAALAAVHAAEASEAEDKIITDTSLIVRVGCLFVFMNR